jgi:hypothetical protein
MMTRALEWPSAMATGRRLRIEIRVMLSCASMLWRTEAPMRPVAPVRMRCIVAGGLQCEGGQELLLGEVERVLRLS